MSKKRTVLLIDDHSAIRFGLRQILVGNSDFTLCGEAVSPGEAQKMMETHRPDLVILDLILGGRDGLELLRELHTQYPSARILVYSAQPEMVYAPRAFQAGAHGYLMKDTGIENVLKALATLARDERYASDAVQRALFQAVASGQTSTSSRETLSDRELQVFRLLGMGRGTAEIAEELSLSMKTIGTFRERLKNKLGAENARQLELRAAEFIRTGNL